MRQARTITIIAEHTGVSPDVLTPDARLEDLGIDSLDAIEITVALEDEFNLDITSGMERQWETVGDIFKAVEESDR